MSVTDIVSRNRSLALTVALAGVVLVLGLGVGVGAVAGSGSGTDAGVETVDVQDGESIALDGCTELDTAGVYDLTENLTSNVTCLEITASDVVLDGNGHEVASSGPEGPAQHGIRVVDATNVTVRDVVVTGWEHNTSAVVASAAGVSVENVNDGRLEEVRALENTVGLSVVDSSEVAVTNATVRDSEDWDVALEESAGTVVSGLHLANETVSFDGETARVRSVAPPAQVPGGETPEATLDVERVGDTGLTLSVAYDAANASEPAALGGWLFDRESSSWTELEGATVDTEAETVSVPIDAAGTVSVFTGEPVRVDECREIDAPGEYIVTENLRSGETCLEITADDVVLDGDGHAVVGRERGGPDQYGVHVNDTESVTVRNVVVAGWGETDAERIDFGAGILLESAANGTVDGVYAIGNGHGVYLTDSTGNTVSNVDATDNFAGVSVWHSDDNTIANVDANESIDGIGLWYSDGNTVVNNVVEENYYGIVLGRSDGTLVANNRAIDADHGLFFLSAHRNTVANNAVTDSDRGIVLDGSSRNVLFENTVTAGTAGVVLESGSDGNTLAGNALTGNVDGLTLTESSNATRVIDTTVDSEEWELTTENSSGTTVVDLRLAGETVSFEGENVRLRAGDTPNTEASDVPLAPPNYVGVGSPIELEATDETSTIDLTVPYTNTSLGDAVDEETLEFWRVDDTGTEWEPVNDSSVDVANRTVSATLTDSGTFAVFGFEAFDLTVSLEDEAGDAVTESTIVTAVDADTGTQRAVSIVESAPASVSLPMGTYDVTVEADGYDPVTTEVTVDGSDETLALELVPEEDSE